VRRSSPQDGLRDCILWLEHTEAEGAVDSPSAIRFADANLAFQVLGESGGTSVFMSNKKKLLHTTSKNARIAALGAGGLVCDWENSESRLKQYV